MLSWMANMSSSFSNHSVNGVSDVPEYLGTDLQLAIVSLKDSDAAIGISVWFSILTTLSSSLGSANFASKAAIWV